MPLLSRGGDYWRAASILRNTVVGVYLTGAFVIINIFTHTNITTHQQGTQHYSLHSLPHV